MKYFSFLFSIFSCLPFILSAQITNASKINNTTIELKWQNGQSTLVDFYADNIVRIFQDPAGGPMRAPEAKPEAQILVANPRKAVTSLTFKKGPTETIISTPKMAIAFNNASETFSITSLAENKRVVDLLKPVSIEKDRTVISLKENPKENFFGGGVQNGRFTHKGKKIAIANENNWTDGGVASPAPFYWSTGGYAFMGYTFKKGQYDFGAKEPGVVTLTHDINYLDVFFMIDEGIVPLLNDYYQLTGEPVLIPKFGLYEGHLNAYNRDYWKEDTSGILFEDGKKYKESQKNNGGIKESLNGEKNNYQFSARAVIDRYQQHNMPLGWILPNDGYGAGYGQTGTLDSNILNLKTFGDYARNHGVQIGLWTQSDLHPKAGIPALLQRDLDKEVGVAGVRVLKTDVAWVGAGYSFGLNGISDAAHIMSQFGHDARPFIITLDGWAGTQRYGTIWTGDQTGGQWEYIRFHIPTYIGAGLSGLPNITSDMDGIFGGKNPIINIRDFQWKTFTPMQLNMDGWGLNPKDPFALGEPATSINRNYLKWKSELVPYSYSIAHQAVDGLPLIRAMFLDQPNAYTLGVNTQYQFMYGPYFLVAPIYKNTQSDEEGNDVRNNIYLPEGKWVDYFSGDEYDGNRILNNCTAPIWKLPVFVKRGAIIPIANPNNHVSEINQHHRIYEIYPYGKSGFTEYDDDGATLAYRQGQFTTTSIESEVTGNRATITIHPAKGDFNGFIKTKSTEFRMNVTAKPTGVTAFAGTRKLKLKQVNNADAFARTLGSYYYNPAPEWNQFATPGSPFAKVAVKRNPMLYVNIPAMDITAGSVRLIIDGYTFSPHNNLLKKTGALDVPSDFKKSDSSKAAYQIEVEWNGGDNADYYEIGFQDMLYTTIKEHHLVFENLKPETNYHFRLRAVNASGHSGWTNLTASTQKDPLEFAIRGLTAFSTAASQPREPLRNVVDFDGGTMWHSKWDTTATPFDLIIDLKSINQLDKLQYLPRTDGGNGTWQKGTVYYSMDRNNWTGVNDFEWQRNGEPKEFGFTNHPSARYLKISVTEAVGKFGSGRELYVFKVPGSQSYLPGDINNDGEVDYNDLTSYMNYTGLKKGDADFEGYISRGDINGNGLIDAFDISNVGIVVDGGARVFRSGPAGGSLVLTPDKRQLKQGETLAITVSGDSLKNVNALSFALPYNQADYEYLGIEPLGMLQMQNFSNDRLHTDGTKTLYPTFINTGNKETLKGSDNLFIIKFRAKKNVSFDLKATNGLLVGKRLDVVQF